MELVEKVFCRSKVTLQEMQSLVGTLIFFLYMQLGRVGLSLEVCMILRVVVLNRITI